MSDPEGKATEPGTAPLFRDEIVSLFLDDATKKAADGFLTVFPPIKQMIKVRTRYLMTGLTSSCGRAFARSSSLVPVSTRGPSGNKPRASIISKSTIQAR